MTPSEREQVESLDRYWDEIPRGAAEHPHGLDPALAETVRDVRALHRPPAIRPAFQRRLEEQLFGAPAAPTPWPGPWRRYRSGPAAPPALNGRAPSHPWNPPRATSIRGRWRPVQLAAAAVLALILVGSFLVFRHAVPDQDAARNVLDAAHVPAVETLVDATIENPAADWTPLLVERWTFPPGDATLSIPPLGGPQWIVAEGSGLVVANGGAEQALTPGVGIVVAAGQNVEIHNVEDDTVSALRGLAKAEFALEAYDGAAIAKEPALVTQAHEALPPGSSRILFERLTLVSGTTLVLEPASGQDWLAVSSGRLGLTLVGDGLPRNWQSGREREIAADELLPALVPGTRVTLRNVGDEPLVLLRLRVLPVDAGTPSDAAND